MSAITGVKIIEWGSCSYGFFLEFIFNTTITNIKKINYKIITTARTETGTLRYLYDNSQIIFTGNSPLDTLVTLSIQLVTNSTTTAYFSSANQFLSSSPYIECNYFNTPPTTTIPPAPDTVTIGTQIWKIKNLDVDRYNDGTLIPQVTDLTTWTNLTTGAWCYYNNDPINNKFGKLYNWYAVAGIWNEASKTDLAQRKNMAPTGFHIPSLDELQQLKDTLYNTAGGNGTTASYSLKSSHSEYWIVVGTNSSGWSGQGGSGRDFDAVPNGFTLLKYNGRWWSNTDFGSLTAGKMMVENDGIYIKNDSVLLI
jgi:uncharacterized protein (TIGR02145 family)